LGERKKGNFGPDEIMQIHEIHQDLHKNLVLDKATVFMAN
jgi:hypothetical protein